MNEILRDWCRNLDVDAFRVRWYTCHEGHILALLLGHLEHADMIAVARERYIGAYDATHAAFTRDAAPYREAYTRAIEDDTTSESWLKADAITAITACNALMRTRNTRLRRINSDYASAIRAAVPFDHIVSWMADAGLLKP